MQYCMLSEYSVETEFIFQSQVTITNGSIKFNFLFHLAQKSYHTDSKMHLEKVFASTIVIKWTFYSKVES